MIYYLFDIPASAEGWITFGAVLLAFILTCILTSVLKDRLPTDIGRAYAVNAAAAKGKPRGAGIIFVLVYAVCSLLFVRFSVEFFIYCVLLICAMLSGFLDDASRIPWGDYKKGLIDLIISFLITLTFACYNRTSMLLLTFGGTVTECELPMWLYLILGTVLVWASINVTNCTDGVDGLAGTLSLITLGSFAFLFKEVSPELFLAGSDGVSFLPCILILMGCIGAYLLFNANPSILLMGDAGSRTIGVFFALAAMKSGAPLMFLLLCLVFILDGGLGLIKVALLRFLKIKILANTRTPLHDHARKNKGWSDTQTLLRFALIHLLICFIALYLLV